MPRQAGAAEHDGIPPIANGIGGESLLLVRHRMWRRLSANVNFFIAAQGHKLRAK